MITFAAYFLIGIVAAYVMGPAVFFTFHGAAVLTNILMAALLP